MMRETSIAAYYKIEADGLLSKRRWQVYSHVYHNGPMTARLAVKQMAQKMEQTVAISFSSLGARFCELERCGVLKIVGETVDPETGHTVYVWDATANLPRKLANENNGPTRSELIHALCLLIEEVREHVKPATDTGRRWVARTHEVLGQCQKHRKRFSGVKKQAKENQQ